MILLTEAEDQHMGFFGNFFVLLTVSISEERGATRNFIQIFHVYRFL